MRPRFAAILAAAALLPISAAAEEPREPSPQEAAFFETKVRPLLAEKCFSCHGPRKQRNELRLDSREAILKGGKSGPAIVPGDPAGSRLVAAISYGDAKLKMPPTGRLSDEQIATLERWIELGAPWPTIPTANRPAEAGEFSISEQDRAYWAFQPIRRPPLPDANEHGSPIDALLHSRLHEKGIQPNGPADRRTLIRRVHFDLLGLPPTPEEVAAFERDDSPQALEKLTDRLLARAQFGERWGRHWLDVVRFGQTNGYERDDEKPEAWRFRDYVIRSFNADKPIDRFIVEQLAGDELPDVSHETIIATGFYRIGVWDDEPAEKTLARMDEMDDIVRTTGAALLGLTVGCARCHDHMFDPLGQDDYYSLLAYFQNITPYGRDKDGKSETHWEANPDAIYTPLATPDQPLAKALSVRETGPNPPPTFVLLRGEPQQRGKQVEPKVPQIFGDGFFTTEAPRHGVEENEKAAEESNLLRQTLANAGVQPTSGRRLQLARWIASRDNPLTARVFVNRVWQHLFGRGIVRTPNDFGHAGSPPTHPELLDWLAAEFIDGGWRVKPLIRTIMLSRTYQMSSRAANETAVQLDPANDLFWRQNMRRLEAEAVRDSILATSGQLNPAMGGRGFFPELSADVLATQSRPGSNWDNSSPDERNRRSVYIFVKRTLMVPMLEAFDYTTTAESLDARPTTTVAPQALLLLNDAFVEQQAAAYAERVRREAGDDPAAQIARAISLAFSHPPTPRETEIAARLLTDRGADGLRSLCLVLLNANEFLYVD